LIGVLNRVLYLGSGQAGGDEEAGVAFQISPARAPRP
jgi:hypothetical protein